MGWKDTLAGAADTARKNVTRNRDKIDQGIEKAADFASTKTGGKYDDTIRKGTEQVRSGLDKVAAPDDAPGTGGATPQQGYPTSPSSDRPPAAPPTASPDGPGTTPPAAPSTPG